jgi:hypothetical protein
MADDKGRITLGTKGPHDDFFCHKYHVWYRVEDCVYRTKYKTFNGCVNCFQGRLNVRSVERGIQPPVCLTSDPIPSVPEAPRVVTNRPTN